MVREAIKSIVGALRTREFRRESVGPEVQLFRVVQSVPIRVRPVRKGADRDPDRDVLDLPDVEPERVEGVQRPRPTRPVYQDWVSAALIPSLIVAAVTGVICFAVFWAYKRFVLKI